jgi:hypothetical protein
VTTKKPSTKPGKAAARKSSSKFTPKKTTKKKETKTSVKSKKTTTKKKVSTKSTTSNTKPVKKKKRKKTEPEEETQFEFRNYFESEPQLDTIDENSPTEEILAAYQRVILVQAKKHMPKDDRTRHIELEDLIAQGKLGVFDAIDRFKNPNRKNPRHGVFQMECNYKIREHIYAHTLGSSSLLSIPKYIQRGLQHVAQIFNLMQNHTVAEEILKRPGPATDQEIVDFIYNEDERLPLKSKTFIRKQISKKVSKEEFEQIYMGVTTHRRGSQHSFVKNNLSNVGKVLHIKEKIWYTFKSNSTKYSRGVELILSAQRKQIVLEDENIHTHISIDGVESSLVQQELYDRGVELCGEDDFKLVFDSICLGLTYEELSEKYGRKRSEVIESVKLNLKLLRQDEIFIQHYEDLK